MTLLAARTRPETESPPAAEVRGPGRAGRLLLHAAALALVLVVVHLLVGPGQLTQADEGAALAQARLLADGDGWAMAHPLPQADPAGTAFPIERSVRLAGAFDYVPYAKHPVYPVLLAAAVRVGGEPGAVALSIAGATLAAVGAALLSRRIAPRIDIATLWCTGVATPLLFYSDVVIAHALGAAAVAFATLALTADRMRRGSLHLGAFLLVLACLLRNEAVLLGVALAAGLALDAWRRRSRSFAPAIVAFAASIGAYLLDPWLQSRVLGGADVGTARIEDQRGYVAGRIDAIRSTLLSPADELPRGTLLGMLVLVGLVGAAWLIRRRAHAAPILLLCTTAALAAVGRLLLNPTGYVPGLLPAAPLMVAGLVLWRGDAVPLGGRRTAELLAATSLLFVVAVSATQYSDGSAGPWGGRYFAVGLPLVTPLAVAGLGRARALIDVTTARLALACIAVVTVALAGVGITASKTSRDLRAGLDRVLIEQQDGLVVSVLPGTGRFQYEHVLEGQWLETAPEALAGRGPELRAAGIDELLLLTPDPVRDAAALAPEFVAVGQPRTVRTTVLGVTSVLVVRVQSFVAAGG